MILLVSGEGPSDIGSCRADVGWTCEGTAFQPGPMAWFVDKLVESHWGYSPLAASSCVFISEHALAHHCREQKMGTTLPGKKKAIETAYFFKNARGLARLAKARASRDKCPVAAILFRDCDGTRSSQKSLWADKVNSMEAGFEAENFRLGVAMVPKPKSEAWLLCAVQDVKYQNCARFEDISGNDASPNSAKDLLDQTLQGRERCFGDVCGMIEQGEIDPRQIAMPSFDRFRERMDDVAREMMK